MSLSILTNDQIKSKFEYRWPRMCLDNRFWEVEKKINENPYDQWNEVKFIKDNYNAIDDLDGQQGIYMFVVKPNNIFTIHHTFILYVGETNNLKQRFKQYFQYVNSKHPSDQKKRRMIVVWENYIYFNYYKTNFNDKKERVDAEYDLIDTIVPPINDSFRSEILSAYKKSLQF